MRFVRRFGLAARLLVFATLVAVWPPPPAVAQFMRPGVLQDIRIEQKLDAQAPIDLEFRDETGRPVTLRQYLASGRPVVLTPVYYECPMLCGMVLDGVLKTMRALPLNIGKDFDVVTVSFNPRETPALAAERKAQYLKRYGRDGAGRGWHFLTGEDSSIVPLMKAVGFRYVYDAASKEYAHAAVIIVLTPEGKVSRYFYGLEYSPRDVRLGLVEASANRIGSLADQVLLFCLHYDPATGKYGGLIMGVMRLAGIATVLMLGMFMAVMFRREKTRARLER